VHLNILKKKAKSVVSVCEIDHPIEWTNTLPDDFSMDNFLSDEIKNKRSQDFPKRYRLNGAIYFVEIELLKKFSSLIFPDNTYAYVMKEESSVDIDNILDFKFASFLMDFRE
jgi:CMP-N,N'-diacetyllegionaminic acid synthase